jgi:hypothetical protein
MVTGLDAEALALSSPAVAAIEVTAYPPGRKPAGDAAALEHGSGSSS